jgi:hypothetical protein
VRRSLSSSRRHERRLDQTCLKSVATHGPLTMLRPLEATVTRGQQAEGATPRANAQTPRRRWRESANSAYRVRKVAAVKLSRAAPGGRANQTCLSRPRRTIRRARRQANSRRALGLSRPHDGTPINTPWRPPFEFAQDLPFHEHSQVLGVKVTGANHRPRPTPAAQPTGHFSLDTESHANRSAYRCRTVSEVHGA